MRFEGYLILNGYGLLDRDLLDLLLFDYLVAFAHVLEKLLILECFLASRTLELQKLKYFFDVSVHLFRFIPACAVHTWNRASAHPVLLSPDAVFAVKSIALWAFKWERRDNMLAQSADKEIDCVFERTLYVYF